MTPSPAALDQSQMPLLDALITSARRQPHAPFYAPGHKRGRGIPERLRELWGAAVFQADLPELPELDNLFAPEGAILAAQALTADAFGAEQSWFLANGSTCGIEAAVLAVCRPGDSLIIPRNAHQSVISALILAGVNPVFLMPDYDADWDLVHGVAPEQVAVALDQHPEARAVLVVSPTYHGVYANLGEIARIVHERHLPLLVDEAHGAHSAFHPELPQTALAAGADLTVQSSHKTLAAMTQASMLHVQGPRIDRGRLQRSLQLTQSTSPSYLLLASLDAARQQMAIAGQELMANTLALAAQIRHHLSQLSPLRVLTQADGKGFGGFYELDLTRLTVEVARCGWDGFSADDYFHGPLGVTAELPTLRHLTFILSHGNTPADGQRLIEAFTQLVSQRSAISLSSVPMLPPLPPPQQMLSPREAFFANNQSVPIAAAVGRPCAELICPYPPGIPVLLPGERVTEAAIAYLQEVQKAGGRITGCADASLATLQVVLERP